MLNVEVVKYRFVNIFLLKFIGNNRLGDGIVKPPLSSILARVLVQWLEGGGRERIAKGSVLVCLCLDIFRQNHFLYVLCILFCCIYSVYNGQVSPSLATSRL